MTGPLSSDAVVRMAGGDWLLARTATAVLFVSPDAAPLVEPFVVAGSAAGNVIDAVTEAFDTGAATFSDASFVIVDWHAAVRVVVHGDVTLVSDHPSLPRLSAAGVGTWVERPVRSGDGPLTIGVEPDRADPATDVRGGVVRAGAFAIEVVVTPRGSAPPQAAPADAPPASDPSASATEQVARTPQRSPAAALAAAAGIEPAAATPDDAPAPEPATAPVTPPPPTPEQAPESAGEAIPGVGRPPERVAEQRVEPARLAGLPPAPGRPAAVAPPSGQVAAIVCPSCDTPNRSDADECRRCGTTWPPDTPSEHVERPRWRLVFEDGVEIVVDHPMVVGREPDETIEHWPSGATAFTVDSVFLSAEHLEIRPVDWDLQVTDLDSSNGSFIITSGDGREAQIEPFTPHRVGHGTWMQIGDRRFRVERDTRHEPETRDPLGVDPQ